MGENIKSNRAVWIVGIIALLIMCAMLACVVIYAVTVIYGPIDEPSAYLLSLTA
jgi:hypothetical protein